MENALYDFYSDLPPFIDVKGKDTTVVFEKSSELGALLERHNDETTYSIAFRHPMQWVEGKYGKKSNFCPLVEGRTDDIVSFVYGHDENLTFFFPHIERKAEFLVDLFETVLPGIKPEIFPCSTQFSWRSDPMYRLPNEEMLLKEQKEVRKDYDARLKELDGKIVANKKDFGFLHDLLTETGDRLVKTVEKFLIWLDFENIVNVDETEPELLEEDLRVENERGLLVIEVKGIGGTSTDGECSQVNKFKLRRAQERGTFDVSALYLVNHQRYLPPEKRRSPPFNKTQIGDAVKDKRGLLTTYDLFKLYFNIANGYITKEDARNAIFETGLVKFNPSEVIRFPEPYKIHHKGSVVTFKSDGIEFRTGATIILDDVGRYRSAQIVDIQVDKTSVEKASSGKIGIELSEKVHKGTELWVRNVPSETE